MAFFWTLFRKAPLCGVYSLKWSYGQLLQSLLWSVTAPFRVIFGLFVASLINALLAWSLCFGGRPSLGRFVVVPYYFNFLIMVLMVLRGIFKVSDLFFYNPTLICTSSSLFLT